jgi:hypothetical protein
MEVTGHLDYNAFLGCSCPGQRWQARLPLVLHVGKAFGKSCHGGREMHCHEIEYIEVKEQTCQSWQINRANWSFANRVP